MLLGHFLLSPPLAAARVWLVRERTEHEASALFRRLARDLAEARAPAELRALAERCADDETVHARYGAIGRRYVYVLLESPVRPAVEAGSVGWSFRPLDGPRMEAAAAQLLGEHDFSAFRSSEC